MISSGVGRATAATHFDRTIEPFVVAFRIEQAELVAMLDQLFEQSCGEGRLARA